MNKISSSFSPSSSTKNIGTVVIFWPAVTEIWRLWLSLKLSESVVRQRYPTLSSSLLVASPRTACSLFSPSFVLRRFGWYSIFLRLNQAAAGLVLVGSHHSPRPRLKHVRNTQWDVVSRARPDNPLLSRPRQHSKLGPAKLRNGWGEVGCNLETNMGQFVSKETRRLELVKRVKLNW